MFSNFENRGALFLEKLLKAASTIPCEERERTMVCRRITFLETLLYASDKSYTFLQLQRGRDLSRCLDSLLLHHMRRLQQYSSRSNHVLLRRPRGSAVGGGTGSRAHPEPRFLARIPSRPTKHFTSLCTRLER